MIYQIRYTPEADRDIETVWDGVHEVSKDVDTADSYVEDLMDAISEKKTFPRSGVPLEYQGLFTGYYMIYFKAYRVFYRVREEYLEVLRILLMKEDYMKILPDLAGQLISDETGGIFHEEGQMINNQYEYK